MICQEWSASSNTAMDVGTAISQVRRLGWDTPYRFTASLLGFASMSCFAPTGIARPSDAAAQAAAWAGLNASDTIAEWARWVNDPDRSGPLLVVAIVLVTISLAAVTAQANVRTPPLRWRGSATFFVGLALYLEVAGDGLAAPLVSLVAALVGWCVWKVRHDDIDPIQFALADLGLALVYAAVIPLVWSITTSPSASTSPAASATPAAHP